MAIRNNGVPECPEGYRRNVYRVNVQVPFRQDEGMLPQEPESMEEEDIQARIRWIEDQIDSLEAERDMLQRRLRRMRP